MATIGFEASLRLAQGAALGLRWSPIHYRTRSNPTTAERAKKQGIHSDALLFWYE